MCTHTQEMDAVVCSYSYHCKFLYWMLYWFQDKQGDLLGWMKLNCAERNMQLLRSRLFNFRGRQGISVWVMNGGKEEGSDSPNIGNIFFQLKEEVQISGPHARRQSWEEMVTPNSSLLGTRRCILQCLEQKFSKLYWPILDCLPII